MRGVLLAAIAFGLVGSSVAAQDRKGIRFWNLTLYTITAFQMSPAGKDSWGPDQCKNDRDGTQDRPRLHREERRGEGRCGLLNRGKTTDGLPQVVSRPTCGRAKDRPPMFAADQPSGRRLRRRSNWDQAASAPDALATWVAIASIKAGERQS